MAQSKWQGTYNYKGFTIWSPSENGWIAEPDWSVKAIERYKGETAGHFETIAKAKKWVREEGVKLKEEDYL